MPQRGSKRPVVWRPHKGPQTRFLSSGSYEALYGGAAGGGKSQALLAGALRYIANPNYTAIIFRRTYKQLERSLIKVARQLIPRMCPDADYSEGKYTWTFPSGAQLLFAHLEHEHDVEGHQSAEYQYIGFDELTHFTQYQYTYMLSRGRSAHGIPIRVRAATNPGGEGHEWVQERWGPWLNPDSVVKAEPGQALYYLNKRDGEHYVPKGTPGALARLFVPARLSDNPTLLENDPEYETRLMGLDPVTRAQLLDGNWLIRPAAGLYFKSGWFKDKFVDAAPANAKRIRYWDRAATKPSKENPDPDWTRGTKMSLADGILYIEDVASERGTPGEVEAKVKTTAELDGKEVTIGIEQDPGSAGKSEAYSYTKLLAGYDVRAYPVAKDKVTRARPASAQAEAGNIRIVRGAWNKAFIDELEAFPDPDWHDDQVDTLSGGYAALLEMPEPAKWTPHVQPPSRSWGSRR